MDASVVQSDVARLGLMVQHTVQIADRNWKRGSAVALTGQKYVSRIWKMEYRAVEFSEALERHR